MQERRGPISRFVSLVSFLAAMAVPSTLPSLATASGQTRCPPGYRRDCRSTCKYRCLKRDKKGRCTKRSKHKSCSRPWCHCLPSPG